MEYAAAKQLNKNVHFIPKSSNNNALSFLRSPFGQILKDRNAFRIVTDMNRKNEQPVYNAGACLIKGLRKLGFQSQCLVFTSDKSRGDQIMKEELSERERQCTKVTTQTADLRSFVNWERKF